MKTRRNHEDPGLQPCIWVSAGVLASRLCDREFDCDHCELHKALSHQGRRQPRGHLAWPGDRRYTHNHLWVQRVDEDSARVGLTPFGAELLHPVEKWEVYRPSTSTPAVVAAVTSAGRIIMTLPFAAHVDDINTRLAVDPLWPLADPWESGFLAEVRTGLWSDVARNCSTLAEIEPHVMETRHGVMRRAARAGHYDSDGVRAADGGMPVAGWGAVLGRSAYRAMLRDLFPTRLDRA